MQTRFEHYAATSMLGNPDAPPRCDGALRFESEWERRAFGIALALSKDGYFEWEDFRQELIAEIAAWEATHALNDSSWHYYQRWLAALEKVMAKAGLTAATGPDASAATRALAPNPPSSTGGARGPRGSV